MLSKWNGTIEMNGTCYDSIQSAKSVLDGLTGDVHLILRSKKSQVEKEKSKVKSVESDEVRVTVKQYMTKHATPNFDFMAKWNNDNPMPFRTMTGVKVKETKGMVYMKLHGDIWAEQIDVCMCCGRALTNPVSRYFGIGPECGGHNYINPFDSDEELKKAVGDYRQKLINVKWEGWIIKSAITKEEQV